MIMMIRTLADLAVSCFQKTAPCARGSDEQPFLILIRSLIAADERQSISRSRSFKTV